MQDYPTIRFLLRHRAVVPPLAAALCVLGGVWAMVRTGVPEAALAGALLGAVAFVAVRAALELVHLISDTLMPR
jgi:hypothetical protein